MIRKVVWLVLPLVLAVVFVAGLVFAISQQNIPIAMAVTLEEEDEPVTIIYWHHNTGLREEYLNQLIDEFNTTNPYKITVVAEFAGSYNEIYAKIISGLQNDSELPNVVVAYPNSFADFARYGGVRFLDEYYYDPTIGITDPEDFFPGVLEYYRLGEYGGQLAGIQSGRSIEVMYYNADLLSEAGLDVPLDWKEFESACINVTSETVSGTIVGTDTSRFATWLWSRGGELLSDDLNTARFDEQPGIDSLLLFQRLIDGGYVRLPDETYEEMNAFGNGQVGFVFASSAGIPFYRDVIETGTDQEWGVTRVPAVQGNEVVDSYGSGQGILQHDDQSDRAAWLFIRWLSDKEQTARWAAVSGYFPVRISATSHISMTEKLASDPQYAQAYQLLDLGRSEPGIRGYNAIREVIQLAVTVTLGNGENVTTTLQTAADEADVILAASGPDSAVIYPSGGTLIYTSTLGISATVEFPVDALVFTETVSYVPLEDLPTDGLAFALVPNLTFSKPVTISLHYRDEDILGMDEENLRLYNYDWSTNSWVDADPCGGYSHYPEENILLAFVCHFSDYSLIDWVYQLFLPFTIK